MTDVQLPRYTGQRFLTADEIYLSLNRDGVCRFTLGHEPCLRMVSKVLARVPFPENLEVVGSTHVLMAGPEHIEYLSPNVHRNGGLMVLGEGLLQLLEQELVRLLLPQFAMRYLNGRHPCEWPFRNEDGSLPSSVDVEQMDDRAAHSDRAIDAYLDSKKAVELAACWQAEWDEYMRAASAQSND